MRFVSSYAFTEDEDETSSGPPELVGSVKKFQGGNIVRGENSEFWIVIDFAKVALCHESHLPKGDERMAWSVLERRDCEAERARPYRPIGISFEKTCFSKADDDCSGWG